MRGRGWGEGSWVTGKGVLGEGRGFWMSTYVRIRRILYKYIYLFINSLPGDFLIFFLLLLCDHFCCFVAFKVLRRARGQV